MPLEIKEYKKNNFQTLQNSYDTDVHLPVEDAESISVWCVTGLKTPTENYCTRGLLANRVERVTLYTRRPPAGSRGTPGHGGYLFTGDGATFNLPGFPHLVLQLLLLNQHRKVALLDLVLGLHKHNIWNIRKS